VHVSEDDRAFRDERVGCDGRHNAAIRKNRHRLYFEAKDQTKAGRSGLP
jgi:hypothetical protein